MNPRGTFFFVLLWMLISAAMGVGCYADDPDCTRAMAQFAAGEISQSKMEEACQDPSPTAAPDSAPGNSPESICDAFDNDEDGLIDEGFDIDGDGYVKAVECGYFYPLEQLDCRDDLPTVNYGAPEVCNNGLDDDCDVSVDEGDCETDSDGDNYVESMGDCDDSDPQVYPGRPEIECNGVDNNCDGEASASADECYVDQLTDDDGDCQCEAPDGCQLSEELEYPEGACPDGPDQSLADCNDSNPEVYEDALEYCDDGADNNCNGIADEGCEEAGYFAVCSIAGDPISAAALVLLTFLMMPLVFRRPLAMWRVFF